MSTLRPIVSKSKLNRAALFGQQHSTLILIKVASISNEIKEIGAWNIGPTNIHVPTARSAIIPNIGGLYVTSNNEH